MQTKKWALLSALTLAMGAACATVGRAVPQPTLTYRDMRVRSLSFEGATLDFDFTVSNPNPVPVHLSSIDYAFELDGKELASGDQPQGIRIAARGESPVTVPVSIRFTDFGQSVAALFTDEATVPYSMQVGFGIDTPAGDVRVPMEKRGSMPLPKLPRARVAGVHLDKMSFSGAKVRFDVEVENPSSIPLEVQSLDYALAVAGVDVGGGETSVPKIAAGQKTITTIPVDLAFAQLGTAAVRAIREERIPYELRGRLDLGAFEHDFTSSGDADLD